MKEDSSENGKQSVTYITKLTENNIKQRLFEKEQEEIERQRKLEEKRRFEEEQQKLKDERQMFEEERRKLEEQQKKHRKHRRTMFFSLIPISIGIIIFWGWAVLKKPLEKISKLPQSQSSETISESTIATSSTTNSSIFPLSSPKRGSLNSRKTLCAEHGFIIGLKTDGTVAVSAGTGSGIWRDDVYEILASEVPCWTDIIALDTNSFLIVGIKKDGTVVMHNRGVNYYSVDDDWNNIVSISVGFHHFVGLKSDGTVVATGDNNAGQCNVENWSDIIMVIAGNDYTIGLKSDGTVVATGDNSAGQCNVENWSDIVSISAYYEGTIGLKSDGTVVATGNNEEGLYNNIENWTDIVKIFSDRSYDLIFGLKENGTLITFNDGESGEISEWSDIIDIEISDETTALRKDGTVVVLGYDLQLDWTNIVAVSTCKWRWGIVGLKADGTVVAMGDDEYGANVDEMKDIQLP